MRIAVVGARLAGSYVSLLLAKQGHEVLLFDDSTQKEKPCGGGVTSKALRTMPWFREHSLPHNKIEYVRMSTPRGTTGKVRLREPIHIFSRSALDSRLRDSAMQEGARFLTERAVKFRRDRGVWEVTTTRGTHEAEFLVGADGATSTVRTATAGRYKAEDLSLALGYYLPGLYHPDSVLSEFQETGFPGYLWSFPRVDHSSVGILKWLPAANAAELRRRVDSFIERRYPEAVSGRQFYAARIPCLSRSSLVRQRVCGDGWALLGDAAGFADAITAEGIFYALRSAELLAGVFREERHGGYEQAWRRDFGEDLECAAAWRDRFFAGSFLAKSHIERMVGLANRSPSAQLLADEWISGRSTYRSFRNRLILNCPRILAETIANREFGNQETRQKRRRESGRRNRG
jgi:flavin-dependent dehydrogenase